ncbi:MAG: hypothetical protein D4R93_00265 [Deltaproteobacteria bacterium]|nr:MAG: hypothetical protein D4R93_00265 [Deltaproteobacteria bacterium]
MKRMLESLVTVVVLVLLMALAGCAGDNGPAGQTGPAGQPGPVGVAAPGGGYVGKQACEKCHSSISHDFNQTGHSVMSRPGFSQYLWKLAKTDQVEVDAIYPNFWNLLNATMAELDKVGYDSNGVVWQTPDKWAGKGVDTSKITIWSGGTLPGANPITSGLGEFMIKGSALTAADVTKLTTAGIFAPDKWYVVGTYLPYKGAIGSPKSFEGEIVSKEANCMTSGCHITGDQSKINSSAAWTNGWLIRVAAGQQPDFELGVTCESCHGQGGNHVNANPPSANNIVNPGKFSLAQQSVGGDGTVNLNYNSATKKYSFVAIDSYLNASVGAKSCATCHSGNQGEYMIAKTDPPAKTILGTPAKNAHFDFTTGTGVNSCTSCHNSHKNSVGSGQLTQTTAQQLCSQCHSNVLAITGSANGWGAFMPIPALDYRHWHGFSVPFPAGAVLSIATASPLVAGTVGTAYGPVTLSATGGTSPYTWTVAAGSTLPAGLTLSSAGVISGTPTTAGTGSTNIKVTDAAAGTASKAFSITVNPAIAALYQRSCSGCHKLGTVDPTGSPDLSHTAGMPSHYPNPGVSGHQGITLSTAEIAALTAYFQAN